MFLPMNNQTINMTLVNAAAPLFLAIFLCLLTIPTNPQPNSDEDSSSTLTQQREGRGPVYGPNSASTTVDQKLPSEQVLPFLPQDHTSNLDSTVVDSAIDETIPRNARYSNTGYGYSSGGTGTGGYGWTGTSTSTGQGYNPGYNYYSGTTNYNNPGYNYNTGGIHCTVCTPYDTVNAQRCCAFGYRQCCNVRVQGHVHHQQSQAGGAGYNYVSPNVYTSTAVGQFKPGTCSTPTFGYSSGGYNQNAGYYATRREDSDHVYRSKRDAPVGQYQAYGPPQTSGGYYYSSGGSNYRPGSGYCRRDYDCPGIQKCCSGYCANPAVYIG